MHSLLLAMETTFIEKKKKTINGMSKTELVIKLMSNCISDAQQNFALQHFKNAAMGFHLIYFLLKASHYIHQEG